MTIVILALLFVFFLYYMLFLGNVMRGLNLLTRPTSLSTPLVTVIVAARNEERSIRQCIQSLAKQTYDKDLYEIIIVDDHSEDRTRDIATDSISGMETPASKVLSLSDHPQVFGKPAAISQGIEVARGEIILCTDADCTPPVDWIHSMIGCFDTTVAFVAGPVLEGASPSIISGLQRLEFLGLISTAAGLIGSGTPTVCNGANVGYRKSAFQRINGYGMSSSTCDDETLMQRIVKRDVGRVVFNSDPNSVVLTPTANDLAGFWNQRTRWASKRGHYEDKSILARLICLYGFFLVLLLSIVLASINASLRAPVGAVVLVKVFIELAVLLRGARIFGQRVSPVQFVIAELFHVPYIVLAGLQGQISSARWKDRKPGK